MSQRGMVLKGSGGLLMVPNFAPTWRLLFPFRIALNISFVSRAQSEFGVNPIIPRDGLSRGDAVF